jgi:CubicO group peptidase (beta-lactamase class C family)
MRGSKWIVAGLAAALLFGGGCAKRALPTASADEAGMSKERLNLVHGLIREAVARKEFPGAVLLVARQGKIILREAYGDSRWVPDRKPMNVDLIFDLASLTKPVATATSIMILAEHGRIKMSGGLRSRMRASGTS